LEDLTISLFLRRCEIAILLLARRRPVSVLFHGNKDIGRLAKRILKEARIGQRGFPYAFT
jgi:hypothetical protein